MSGLNVYRSNRMETLVEVLARKLAAAPLPDPFEAEQIVVGNLGMEGWLSRQLAQRLGVCANVRYLFPADVLDRSLALLCGDEDRQQEGDPWSTDALTWGIMACLPGLMETPEHREAFRLVRSYLAWEASDDAGDSPREVVTRHRYALARQVADVFDRYAVFRPAWALAWSEGKPAPRLELPPELAWQPVLWQALQRRAGDRGHLAGRVARAATSADTAARRSSPPAEAPGYDSGAWPGFQRLTVFGLSSLPPVYLDVLDLLSRLAEVNLYMLCPSPEYWEDLTSRGEQAARRRRMARDELTHHLRQALEEADRPEGAPLLASLGRIARDFQVVLEALPGGYTDGGGPAVEGLFSDPVQDSALPMGASAVALHWLQSDVYNVRHPAGELERPVRRRRALRPSDDSLQLHACHGPTRQVEVLRDVLLGLFQDHPHLQPRDVVVMTPDIETYAPLVSAVFDDGPLFRLEQAGRPERGPDGWGAAGAPRVPYRIADLSLRRTNPVADALLRVLELASGRMEASAVLDLLGLEPVRRRFGLEEDDMPQVQEWIRGSGIRWGADVAHRRAEGLPADAGNTWGAGLQRLTLGVAMAGEHRLFGTAPYDDMEGDRVALLGCFLDLCATLMDQARALRRPRTLDRWAARLDRTLDAVTATSARAGWLTRRVRDTLKELDNHGAMQAPVELDAVRAYLEGRFELPAGRDVNPGGAVTFCALVPMRSIPHRVVCLLGMDEEAFPRNPGTVGFDLTSRNPRVGDRDPRDEDRLLLLEALLAAREHLVITYTGHDVRTNKEQTPAAPVDELLDVIDQSFPAPSEGVTPRAFITTHHRLQAFSPDNFRPLHRDPTAAGLRPWSFDRRLRTAAARLQAARVGQDELQDEPFVTPGGSPPEPDAGPEVIRLADLIRFFKHPVQHLLSHGLRLDLEERTDLVEDREPIELDPLQCWSLDDSLLSTLIQGVSPEQAVASLVAQGRVPLGTPGSVLLDERLRVVTAALRQADQERHERGALPPLQIDLQLAGARLQGQVDRRVDGRCVLAYVGGSKSHGRRMVEPWILHLAWRAQEPEVDSSVVQVLAALGDDGAVAGRVQEFSINAGKEHPAEYALRRLGNLVELYQRGMQEPLPLFVYSSYIFARHVFEDVKGRHPGNDPPPDLLTRYRGNVSWARGRAMQVWRRRSFVDKPPGDLDDAYVAQVHGDRCALTADGDDGSREVDAEFATLAVRFWWPLRRALQERGVRL